MVLMYVSFVFFFIAIGILIYVLVKKDISKVKFALISLIIVPICLFSGALISSYGELKESSTKNSIAKQSSSNEQKQLAKESKEEEKESTQKSEEESESEAQKAKYEAINKDRSTYDTTITYEQLARVPADYAGKKIVQTGRVVQVIEGDETNHIRVAIDNNSDNVMLIEYKPTIVSQRVLEGDMIKIYAMSAGTTSYKSTLGGTITIPSALAFIIDFT